MSDVLQYFSPPDPPFVPTRDEALVIVSVIFCTLALLIIPPNLIYLRRKKVEYIQQRYPEQAALATFSLLLASIPRILNLSIIVDSPLGQPCIFRQTLVYFFFPPFFIATFLRTINLLYAHWANRYLIEQRQQMQWMEEYENFAESDMGKRPNKLRKTFAAHQQHKQVEVVSKPTKLRKAFLSLFDFVQFEWLDPRVSTFQRERNSVSQPTFRTANTRSGGRVRALGTFLLGLAIGIFLFLLSIPLGTNIWHAKGCGGLTMMPFMLLVVVTLIVSLIFLWLLRDVEDSYHVHRELNAMCLVQTLTLILQVAAFWYPEATYNLGADVVGLVAIVTFQITTIDIPLITSFIYERRMKGLISAGNWESFQRILQNPAFMNGLQEQLARDLCIENALFLDDLKAFMSVEKQLKKVSGMDEHAPDLQADTGIRGRWRYRLRSRRVSRQDACLYLIETYVKSGSAHELNLTSSTRRAIIKAYDAGEYEAGIFNHARNEVENLIFRNTFIKLKNYTTAGSVNSLATV